MKKYLVIIILFASVLTVNAQSLWNVTYDVSVPMGDTKDFIGETSFRGYSIDGRAFINGNVTLGGSWTWNIFHSTEQDITTEIGNITVTGNHYNYGNYMPIMFNTHYYFGTDGGIRPFIGTGIGTIWKEERKNIGTYNVIFDNAWQFGFTPEIGAFIPVGTGAMFFVHAKYTYGISTSELSTTSYLSFGIGLAWENF